MLLVSQNIANFHASIVLPFHLYLWGYSNEHHVSLDNSSISIQITSVPIQIIVLSSLFNIVDLYQSKKMQKQIERGTGFCLSRKN